MFSNSPKNCKLTIYVDRPAMMVPKKIKRNRPNGGVHEASLSGVGHVFLGLTDENGVEKRIGFYGKSYAVGAQNVDPRDRINGPQDAFKKVAGIVQDETHRRYHDAIQYKISKEQYDEAFKYIENWKKEDPKYVLLLNNCVSFAIKTARNVGLRPPAQLLFGLPSPHGTSLAIQLKHRVDQVGNVASNIAKKLSRFFGGAGDVVQIQSPDFLKKASKVLTTTVKKVVSETTLGFVNPDGKTSVESKGVETELSDTMPNKNITIKRQKKETKRQRVVIRKRLRQGLSR